MARCVDDIALLSDVLNSLDTNIQRAPEAPRIGLCKTPHWSEANIITQKLLLHQTAEVLKTTGTLVSESSVSSDYESLTENQSTIMVYEAYRNYSDEFLNNREQLIELLIKGKEFSLSDYQNAKQSNAYCQSSLKKTLANYDALLAPSAPGKAPMAEAGTGNQFLAVCGQYLAYPQLLYLLAQEKMDYLSAYN